MKKLTTLFTLIAFSLNSCLVSPASEENSIEVKGTVVDISEGGTLDVTFTLKGDDNIY